MDRLRERKKDKIRARSQRRRRRKKRTEEDGSKQNGWRRELSGSFRFIITETLAPARENIYIYRREEKENGYI